MWFGNSLPSQVGIVEKDIFDLSVEDLSGYDQVIFLAGLSNDPMADLPPARNFIFNEAAPVYFAYIAKKAKVKRYVYACSCSVYAYTEDTASAYVRAVEANYKISGVFNIASGNYTVGEVADHVRRSIEEHTGWKINVAIKSIQDIRNYKVTIQRAQNVLSFHPQDDVRSIVANLLENKSKFGDWDNPLYYNIETFKRLIDGQIPAFRTVAAATPD
jgi:nucleoside-diphosphate-sugar epimerase